MKPQFKELRFKSEADFKKWLDKETYVIIEFNGDQDLQRIHVYKSGEILHCNLQAGIWNGAFVHIPSLKVGKNIEMTSIYNGNEYRTMDFVVRSLTFQNL